MSARATALVEKGYHVIEWRLTPDGRKRPTRPGWQKRPATLTEAKQFTGEAGIVPGEELVVVDVDVKNGKEGLATLHEWRTRFPVIFDSPIQHTPSGGLHFFFRVPNGYATCLPNGKVELAPGIDVLTGDRFAAVYTDTLPTCDTLPVLPAEVFDYFVTLAGARHATAGNSGPGRGPSLELLQKVISLLPNEDQYDSRDDWFRIVMAIKGACEGTDFEEHGEDLAQAWSAKWPGGNDPAYVSKTYQDNRPKGGWLVLMTEVEKHTGVSLRLEEARAIFGAAEPLPAGESTEEAEDDPWTCVADALANPDSLKPPPAVIPRFAFAGRVTLLAAPEKAGKSTLVGQGVAALTSGAEFLADQLAPAGVLWVCIDEHPDDLVRRLGRHGVDGRRVHFTTRLLNADEIAAKIQATGARLCVVDTLTEWITRQGGDPNREADVLSVIRLLRDVARATGCAFLLLHHTVRDGSRYAGSHQIGASVDLLIEMKRRESRREFKPLGRFPVAPFALAFDTATERYRLAEGAPSLESVVLEAIRAAPGLSMRQAQQATGKRREDVSAAVLRLLAAGQIRNEGTEGRWKLYPVNLGDVFMGADDPIEGVA